MSIKFRRIDPYTLNQISQAIKTYLTRNNDKIPVNQFSSKIEENFNRDLKEIVEAEDFFELTELQLKGITKIGSGALNWYWLKSLVIPEIIAYINEGVCNEAPNLEKVRIGTDKDVSLKQFIGDKAFQNCKNLKELKVEHTVKTIGDNAFENCKNLETVNIESDYRVGGITFVSEGAFKNCTNLTDCHISLCGTDDEKVIKKKKLLWLLIFKKPLFCNRRENHRRRSFCLL